MKFASRVSSRSVVTTGRGSSVAGITCTAVKDGASWTLEAGALVLADGEWKGAGGQASVEDGHEEERPVGAGLVCTAEDGASWTLEAGALVQAESERRGHAMGTAIRTGPLGRWRRGRRCRQTVRRGGSHPRVKRQVRGPN